MQELEKIGNVKWSMSGRLVSYFAGAIYSQHWDTIAVRELLQNSIDSGAKSVEIRTSKDGTELVFENDGNPMTLKEVKELLFTLGESSKTQKDDVGFWGVGECAVLAPCSEFKIETGDLLIDSNGDVYRNQEHVKGTRHTLEFKETARYWMIQQLLRYCRTDLKITLNGQRIAKRRDRGRRMDLKNAVIWWVKNGDDITVLRVKGLVQSIKKRFDSAGTFIVDLESSRGLNVSREEIKEENLANNVSAVISRIIAEKEHLTDEKEEWETIQTVPFVFLRQRGYRNRHDLGSRPVRKIAQAVRTVVDFYAEKRNKELEWGLMVCNPQTQAMVYNGVIYVNIDAINLNPPAEFALKLVHRVAHEVAHLTGGTFSFSGEIGRLLDLAAEKYQIYSQIRKIARE